MKRYTIELEFDVEGNMKSVVKGVKGKACGELSKWLDELGKVTHDSDTPEARETERVQVTEKVAGR
jgi:Protein of unknown function (DUF2997)